VKLPLLRSEHCTAAWVTSIGLGIACLVWRNCAFQGWEYAAGTFLIGLAVLLALFSSETSKSTTQFGMLVFAIGTGVLLMAARFEGLINGISFGPALLIVNNQLGLLSGLLWLIPVLTTFRFAGRYSENIYVRSLLGAILVLAASVFMMQTSESLMILFWKRDIMPWKALLLWFVAAFFFHFAGHQMQITISNPISFRLFLTYIGFFAAQLAINLIRSM
jgi:hypothetical protein